MSASRPVLVAGPADRPIIARTLALAFQDDPVFRWMLPGDERRRACLPDLFDVFFRTETGRGEILKAPDGEAASFWRAPGKAGLPAIDILPHAGAYLRIFGFDILRALAVSNAIEAHFPKTPFWYAHFIGVSPAAQNHGWGSAMVRAGIARAEAAGVELYLETARPENVRFYLGHGFAVTGEWDVKGGPHFWSMLRPAAPAGSP